MKLGRMVGGGFSFFGEGKTQGSDGRRDALTS